MDFHIVTNVVSHWSQIHTIDEYLMFTNVYMSYLKDKSQTR